MHEQRALELTERLCDKVLSTAKKDTNARDVARWVGGWLGGCFDTWGEALGAAVETGTPESGQYPGPAGAARAQGPGCAMHCCNAGQATGRKGGK